MLIIDQKEIFLSISLLIHQLDFEVSQINDLIDYLCADFLKPSFRNKWHTNPDL
jgi:hypothetical protein